MTLGHLLVSIDLFTHKHQIAKVGNWYCRWLDNWLTRGRGMHRDR